MLDIVEMILKVLKCPRLLYQSQCEFSVDSCFQRGGGPEQGTGVPRSGTLVLVFLTPASPLLSVQILKGGR